MMDYKTARKAMVDCQIRPSDIMNTALINTMLEIPREIFLPNAKKSIAYIGEHIDLGSGKYMLDPRIFAKMIEALDLQPTDYVLDIGCTTGYSTAVLGNLVQTVVAVDSSHDFTSLTETNTKLLNLNNCVFTTSDLSKGCAQYAPYDAIFINGAIANTPQALLEQLCPEKGRLVTISANSDGSYCTLWRRKQDSFSSQRLFDAIAPILPEFSPEPAFVF